VKRNVVEGSSGVAKTGRNAVKTIGIVAEAIGSAGEWLEASA
jgi:hypothetical protein